MCNQDPNKVNNIIKIFSDHNTQKTNSRHISRKECISAGLNIANLEDNQELQDAVLTTHRAYMHTFLTSGAVKLIENQWGQHILKQLLYKLI